MENPKDMGSIRIPNNVDLLTPALSYAEKVAGIMDFAPDDCNKIQLSVEEACLNCINNSFLPGESGEINLHFFKRFDGIEIHIHDMGLPYDPSLEPVYDPKANLLEKGTLGLGSFLISQTMDEFRFNNLGIKGKEVVLIKYFDSPLIAQETDGQKEPEVVPPPADNLPVEQIKFNIRRMVDEEALEVCRCIYDCYGYSYANENVYFPERVAAMNRSGKLLSSVALTDEGEMGGHFALIFYEKLPAEVGIAVTKKKFRGQGFARQLGEFLEIEARKLGLNGLQVKMVTAHPYTQKFCMKLGYKDCGLLLAHSPKTLSFKGIADKLKQRNSDVLAFKYLEEPKTRQLYLPSQHRDMIALLYHNIGDTVECISIENPMPLKEKCSTEVNVNTLRSLAEMFVLESGQDTLLAIRNEMRKIFMDEIQVIELYLPLSDPMTPVYVTQLEGLGFIFTGILPETKMGDTLIMQYFNGVHIDYSQIILVSEVSKKLLAYVSGNDPHYTHNE